MEETSNHLLNTYNAGELDWTHSPDMEHIEERLTVRDTEANLSNYTPHAGAEFIATDTGATYDGDGSSWNKANRDLDTLTVDNFSIDSWNKVDLVEAGADPTGSTAINSVFDAEKADNTLLILPPGTYLIDSPLSLGTLSNVGVIGLGATIEAPGYTGDAFEITGGREQLVKGLEFDMTGAGEGYRVFQVESNDRMLIEDCTVTGEYDNSAETGMMYCGIIDADGTGVIRNLDARDGATERTNGGTYGILMPDHVGEMTFDGCHVHHYPNNSLYASGDGKVIVDGGTYRNSGNACVRFHGDGSVARDVTIVMDDATHGNQRGIWLRGGASHRVENCHITVSAGDYNPISIHGLVESAEIVSTDIEVNGSVEWIITANDSSTPNSGITFRDCRFYGDNASTNGDYYIICNREGTLFDGCFMDAVNTAADKRGINVQFGDITIRDCEISAANPALDVNGSNANIYNTDTSSTEFGRSLRVQGGSDSVIRDCSGPVDIQSSASDTVIENHDGSFIDNGTRTLRNGWGTNAGDPTSSGDWTGNGYEGLMVRDTTNSNNYVYVNGGWVTL